MADGMDVLAVAAAAAANKGSSVVAEEPAAAKDSIDGSPARQQQTRTAFLRTAFLQPWGPQVMQALTTCHSLLALSQQRPQDGTSAPPAPLSHFHALTALRGSRHCLPLAAVQLQLSICVLRTKKMELESMRLERLGMSTETEVMRRDMRQSNDGNSERPSKVCNPCCCGAKGDMLSSVLICIRIRDVASLFWHPACTTIGSPSCP